MEREFWKINDARETTYKNYYEFNPTGNIKTVKMSYLSGYPRFQRFLVRKKKAI